MLVVPVRALAFCFVRRASWLGEMPRVTLTEYPRFGGLAAHELLVRLCIYEGCAPFCVYEKIGRTDRTEYEGTVTWLRPLDDSHEAKYAGGEREILRDVR